MTVGSQLTVDGTAQVQHVNNGLRTQVEDLFHGLCQNFVLHLAGAEGIHIDGYRMSHTNGIGQLDLALVCQAGCHNVLGNIPGCIGSGAVHLGRVLTREGAAAMTTIAAIGVHDDLASGQTAVTMRAAYNKASGGVYKVLGLVIQQFIGNDGLDHIFQNVGTDLLGADIRRVLVGDDDGVDAAGLVVHIFHSHLGLAVGTQIGESAVLAHLSQTLGELVGQ